MARRRALVDVSAQAWPHPPYSLPGAPEINHHATDLPDDVRDDGQLRASLHGMSRQTERRTSPNRTRKTAKPLAAGNIAPPEHRAAGNIAPPHAELGFEVVGVSACRSRQPRVRAAFMMAPLRVRSFGAHDRSRRHHVKPPLPRRRFQVVDARPPPHPGLHASVSKSHVSSVHGSRRQPREARTEPTQRARSSRAQRSGPARGSSSLAAISVEIANHSQ